MHERLLLGVRREGASVRLTSPAVGELTCAIEPGRALAGGQVAGVLCVLGRAIDLIVPDDVAGIVRSARPERVREPAGYGSVLYELAPLETAYTAAPRATATKSPGAALVFRSQSSGRFWHRASPAEAPLIAPGKLIESGMAIGLIEVMKTFTLVQYVASSGLPSRARVARVLVADGAEVSEHDALLELEPA